MPSRWALMAFLALLACVLLFLLHVSEPIPQLQLLNIWIFSGAPLLIWVLAFGARAYAYGGALGRFQFLQEEAQGAQQSWQNWAQRSLVVHASCVLLPDQVSASLLSQGDDGIAPRVGQARRIATLPTQREERALAGLHLLLPALEPVLQALPAGQELRVTFLSDIDPEYYPALHDAWRQSPVTANHSPSPTVTVARDLSYQWIEEKLKAASAAFELILVLQVHGEAAYSDGLAGLLLCPDSLARAWELPVKGALLRPMPLDASRLGSELTLFLNTQPSALRATDLLADGDGWRPLMAWILSAEAARGASLAARQQWILEGLCGLPGPFGHWLAVALGVEMALHQQRPVVVLAQEESRHWISTVNTGALV
ncbi:hypothetical protein [Pseudomonas gingeri]|uniref:Type VI secretion protein n=1 Tax=Pseudomonas gingeri TaxID=117681 RepID=A0A7Y8CMT6_9PSED|nr:hypothetical protein [Pseudomonas gingeri]NWA05438.1 hypothetical protein [Pseudomonas gingeri]NWA18560.1 hypothetical protein [Pseudomonas gingeri]NWA58670.1 hypothetical protein [Pseudomonas gingeri]NWA99604.1 hypothetical protein [Pseudomonas gingeri]NWB06248.1 hypothetical protein [Pseudomonas gingeri]